jgi:hypothetical protein
MSKADDRLWVLSNRDNPILSVIELNKALK